VYIHFYSP